LDQRKMVLRFSGSTTAFSFTGRNISWS